MDDSKQDAGEETRPTGVNPGYAVFQIARAFTTSAEHADPAVRERAEEKIRKWQTILSNILNHSVEYGSRTPVAGIPGWATLEVITGGFATGGLLAEGPVQEHERKLLEKIPGGTETEARRALNAYFLTDAGLSELQTRLRDRTYDINVPEEGALMVVAWLAGNGYEEQARELLTELSPYFPRLRFYPVPLDKPRVFGPQVHLQDVGSTIGDLEKIEPNQNILAQKEAIEVWAPFYDRMVALFFETVRDGIPCHEYPADWPVRARTLLEEYAELRKKHNLCGKPERVQGHFFQLRGFLQRCSSNAEPLTSREVGRLRVILRRYVEKRGLPDSRECADSRRRQRESILGPTFYQLAGVVIPRFAKYSKTDGVDDVSTLKQPVTADESVRFDVPAGTPVPGSIQRKIDRCLDEDVPVLVQRDIITSGDTLARVLPQMTSGLQSGGIADPALRHLYSAIYRAFRLRRSLLLLNLEKQIRIEELPWVKAIDTFRTRDLSDRERALRTLEELSLLAINSFPHAIIPNKLLQELRALVKSAGLDVPLVEEVAADIFMRMFSGKFLAAAKCAAPLMEDTIYTAYYGIDWDKIRKMPAAEKARKPWFFPARKEKAVDRFAELCSARAGIPPGEWRVASNGMIIEQQQILTTQNLAALAAHLKLPIPADENARKCFAWICKRSQMKITKHHARLIMVKNTAYAWRQMIFFLALLPKEETAAFIRWAGEHFDAQDDDFKNRFRPAMAGLKFAASGGKIDGVTSTIPGVRRFLGWSKESHWLLAGA